jgi:hypothetical protein
MTRVARRDVVARLSGVDVEAGDHVMGYNHIRFSEYG